VDEQPDEPVPQDYQPQEEEKETRPEVQEENDPEPDEPTEPESVQV